MRSNFARIGITALLALGNAGCDRTSIPIAPDAKAASAAAPTPVSAPNCTPPQGPQPRPDYCSYPADVRDFVDMRDACDHWRGEPVPEHEDDPEEVRKNQIIDAINESCTGTDKRLSALKAAYAGDQKVLQLLDEYETDIEAGD